MVGFYYNMQRNLQKRALKKKPLEDSKPLHRNTFSWTFLLVFINFSNISYLMETMNNHYLSQNMFSQIHALYIAFF